MSTVNSNSINPVLTNFIFDGKPSGLTKIDKLLKPANTVWSKGRKVTLYKNTASNDYSTYSVKTSAATTKDIIKVIAMCASLIIPILIFLKAINKENRKIAKIIPNLTEIPAPISLKISGTGQSHLLSKHSHTIPAGNSYKSITGFKSLNGSALSAKGTKSLPPSSDDTKPDLTTTPSSAPASPGLFARIFGIGNNSNPSSDINDFTKLPEGTNASANT